MLSKIRKCIVLCITLSSLIAGVHFAINQPAHAESIHLRADCEHHGIGYFNIPNSEWCLRLGGEIRSRYQMISASDSDFKSQFDVRGRLIIDSRKQTARGPLRTHIKFSGDSNGIVTISDGFAQIGKFSAGLTDSFGNLTYGSYALNANHSLYHADNSGAQFGYTFEIGKSNTISVSLEELTSEMPYINFDLGTSAETKQNWGTLGIASGVLIHYLEEGGFNKEHPTYLKLTPAELEAAGEPEELGTFGIYLGGGGEFPIPLLYSTKIGFTGFYYRGGASKLGLPKQKVAKRIETGDMAGRPIDLMGHPISRKNYSTATPDQIERFKDFTLVPTEDTTDAPYIQQQYIPWGFSINGGISHAFNSYLKLNLNGGFYNTFDYDYSSNSFMFGTSFDITPLNYLVFSLAGEFESGSIKYTGDNDAISREFEADGEGTIDPSFSTTISITSTF